MLLGDYDFYELSLRCNIIKLIKLIERLKEHFPGQIYYKPHPGTVDNSHHSYFSTDEILPCDIPVENLSGEFAAFLTLGSAAVIELKRQGATVLGIGKIVDMCEDLFQMSERQGLKHLNDLDTLLNELHATIDAKP